VRRSSELAYTPTVELEKRTKTEHAEPAHTGFIPNAHTVNKRKGVGMTETRIKVRGIRKETISSDELALVYWLLAKRAVEQKRERDAEAKRRRSVKEADDVSRG
jgi:hypothetical protein